MEEISSCVESLLENDPEVAESAVDVLMKISDNILKDPGNEKFRSVSLSSSVVERKLLPVVGALEVLFLMGFEEADNKLVLPQSDSLDNMRLYRDQLITLKKERLRKSPTKTVHLPSSGPSAAGMPSLTQNLLATEAEMKSLLLSNFERVLVYESPSLQEKALQSLPLQSLQNQARSRLLVINKDSKDDKPLDFQDCLLIEVLAWFKNSFFTWFDCPQCPMCQSKMTGVGSLPPSEEDLVWGGNRVEGYACMDCNTSERFPRYSHPGKLLETRRGRCGEWGNCFCLLCRALGMDVRYVLDCTDHVWAEIYSQSQRRWLHVDCCENKLDMPLMYEHGWNKKLTYIFAFSKDEVVDVTWRYTTMQKDVLKRRNRCREKWLVSTMMQMNKQRQETFQSARRSFLEMRLVAEVAELLKETANVKEGEKEGRCSGSLEWRLNRGETQSVPVPVYTFLLDTEEVKKKEFVLKYSPAQDLYVRPNAKDSPAKGWQFGVKSAKNIFRKHEPDWKMVYLSRTEGSSEAEVSWEVVWSHTQLRVKCALVVFQHVTFENGRVDWQVCTGNLCVNGNKDGVLELTQDTLKDGDSKLVLSAVLTGGKGSTAWQHTQLFRQTDSSSEFPFFVRLQFE